MREVPLPFAVPDIGAEEAEAVREVLESGWLTTGPKTAEFEARFAARVGAGHALAVNSCTAAMHLALEAMGVTEGDEVITSPYTFTSTAEVIRYLGARPVFIDIDPPTLNLDPALIEPAITPRTKVIAPVHVAGQAADMTAVLEIASGRGLSVMEDCAHAFPATHAGRMIGADLDRTAFPGVAMHATCFSFYATKTITTGEGGMLCTDDRDLAERARMMSLHGLSRDAWKRYTREGSWYYEILSTGFKYNLTDIAAAMGLAQLSRADAMWERRRNIAMRYETAFGDLPELQVCRGRPGDQHAWHLYPVRLNPDTLTIDRDGFIEELKASGIGASVHFIPLHLHPVYQDECGYRPDDFPLARREYLREISLPIYSKMTDEDVEDVVQAVHEIVGAHRIQES
ncbi:MAG: DegT/DnrJ/EryC1/StrS family aminotransferase [Thermoleophilia bacterium]|nr:DegT/DnrJ/EryC1/StrS family aminotransferase [Thermoleophilia bacterium]